MGNSRTNNKQTKLKASLVPGAVVILLAGRFKGRRAIFLKQLDSGLCLITGPFAINGIPLRRVPQSYVIGTSTQLDASKVDASSVGDDLFKNPRRRRRRETAHLMKPKLRPNSVVTPRLCKQRLMHHSLALSRATTSLRVTSRASLGSSAPSTLMR